MRTPARILCALAFCLVTASVAATSTEALIEHLEARDPLTRYAAAHALGALGPAARPALPALLAAMRDAAPWVRVEAARAVVLIGPGKADVRSLAHLLADADIDVGLLAGEALAQIGPPAVKPLLAVLGGEDRDARRYALQALALLGRHAAEATPKLIDLVAGEDPATRRLAGEALRQVGPWAREYVPDLVDKLRFGKPGARWVVLKVLAKLGPGAAAAVPAVRELLEQGDPREKEAAAATLKRIDIQPLRPVDPALYKPELAQATAPARFRVRFETTRGVFTAEFVRAWAPHGVDRVYNLARIGYFDANAFFRVMKGFVAQFGLSGESRANSAWSNAFLPDDARKKSNKKGTIVFAQGSQPGTRTTQLFVNLADNPGLDKLNFAPVGRVVEGLEVVEALYSGYGDGPPRGEGPEQRAIRTLGNAYLQRGFPRLDYIKRADLIEK